MSDDEKLVEAFLVLYERREGPGREATADVVFKALSNMRPRLSPAVTVDEHDEAVAHLMWRLVDPERRADANPPGTPGRVRGYLRKSLTLRVLDVRKQRARESDGEMCETLPDTGALAEESLLEAAASREHAEAFAALLAWLHDELIPQRGERSAEKKRRCFEEMIALARGATTLDDLHRAELEATGRSPDGGALATVAATVYKRHWRALEWAWNEAQAARAEGRGDARFDALERLVGELRRRGGAK